VRLGMLEGNLGIRISRTCKQKPWQKLGTSGRKHRYTLLESTRIVRSMLRLVLIDTLVAQSSSTICNPSQLSHRVQTA